MSNQPPETILATVNGQPHQCRRGQTLTELLADLGLRADHVAIELERRIVKPAEWSHTAIPEGAEIEIVHFVGGGRDAGGV